MVKKGLHILILISFFIASYKITSAQIINLSCQENIGITNLSGTWEFYWMRLLNPEDLANDTLKPVLVKVPSSWTRYRINGRYLPSKGYATYHIKLILPKQKRQSYSFKITKIFSAYKLWINDSLVIEVGRVATKQDKYKPLLLNKVINFTPSTDTLDIVLQVANFSHDKAGVIKPIIIGKPNEVFRESELKILIHFLFFGGLLIFSIFHFWLYFYRKLNISTLVFALASLFAALYTLFDSELIITLIDSEISYFVFFKFNYIFNYLRAFFLSWYFYLVIYHFFSKIWRFYFKAILYIMVFLIVIVLVTSVHFYTQTLNVFMGLLSLVYLGSFYGFIRKLLAENHPLAFIPFAGFIFLGLFMFNDILYDLNIVNTLELSNLGIFIFVSTQSITLAHNHSKLYNAANRLTEHIEKLDTIKRQLLEITYNSYKNLLSVLQNYFKSDNLYLFEVENEKPKLTVAIYKQEYIVDKESLESIGKQVLMEFIDLALNINEVIYINSKNRLLKYIKRKTGLNIESLLVARLGTREKPIGIIYFEKLNSEFTIEQKKILQLITTQITAIVNNIRLFNHLEDINRNLMNIVNERTAKIREKNMELEARTVELDEKIEELRVTSEVISEMNKDLIEQQSILKKKNELLSEQTQILAKQKALVEDLNRQIKDSVNYARRIQMALLNADSNLPECPHFIIFRPHDVVSGDFWWSNVVFQYRIFILGDTNMHGVVGAFMSVLSFSILNDVASNLINRRSKEVTPDIILNQFNLIISNIDIKGLEDIKLSVLMVDTEQKKLLVNIGSNYGFLFMSNQIINLQTDSLEYEEYDLDSQYELLLFTDGFPKALSLYAQDGIDDILLIMKNLDLVNKEIYLKNRLTIAKDFKDDVLVIGIKFEIG